MNWSIISLLIPSAVNPLGQHHQFQAHLTHALNLAQLSYQQIDYQVHQGQAQITTNNATIIFSTTRNPYWQVSSLQRLLKIATIEKKRLKLVDFKVHHPYVTFENN